jgi:hypothetical protein
MKYKIDPITFDSIVHREAYRNGFENYDLVDDYKVKLSSTAHRGKVEVTYDVYEGYMVYDTVAGVEFSVGNEYSLGEKLRELAKFYWD